MRRSLEGFSTIELIIVIGLIGVVALFSTGMGFDAIGRSVIASERDTFVSLILRGARADALANIREVSHGIKIDNNAHEYVLFDGTTYSTTSSSNRHIPYSSTGLTVSNTGGNIIVFEQLSGSAITGAGTTTISGNGKTQTIIIRSNGQIDW